MAKTKKLTMAEKVKRGMTKPPKSKYELKRAAQGTSEAGAGQ